MSPFLPPATKMGQGNSFTSVCQEFCSHPGAVHARRYGQQAGGTHPAGMHTFFVPLQVRVAVTVLLSIGNGSL